MLDVFTAEKNCDRKKVFLGLRSLELWIIFQRLTTVITAAHEEELVCQRESELSWCS